MRVGIQRSEGSSVDDDRVDDDRVDDREVLKLGGGDRRSKRPRREETHPLRPHFF